MPELQDLNSLEMYTARLSGYNVIYLNLQNPAEAPFFTDPTVRQALLVALDRQALIDEALNGQGLVATGPILPWSWAYHPQQPLVDFDLAKAKGLLDAAGWVDSDEDGIREREGRPFTFTLLTTDDPDKIAVAEAVSKQWLQIGVVADIEIMGAGLGERLTQHRFQAILAEISLSGDPDPYPLWHQTQIEGGQNYGGWSHEQASQLLEAARTIANTGRRNDFYFEFQQIFTEEVPALILFYPVYTYGVHQDVLGVQLGPLTKPSDRFRNIADWYLLTRQVIYSESQFPGEVRQGLQNP
jgi:peptide/nickel transport system substrate-binding protein